MPVSKMRKAGGGTDFEPPALQQRTARLLFMWGKPMENFCAIMPPHGLAHDVCFSPSKSGHDVVAAPSKLVPADLVCFSPSKSDHDVSGIGANICIE